MQYYIIILSMLFYYSIFFHDDNSICAASHTLVRKVDCPIDTVFLSVDSVVFHSDISSILNDCLSYDINYKELAKKNIINIQSVFNKELKTSAFDKIKVVTGKNIKFDDMRYWVSIMEWHFETEEDCDLLEKLLKQLDRGIIRHTIYPSQCTWGRQKSNKIYLAQYRPIAGEMFWIDSFLSCLN